MIFQLVFHIEMVSVAVVLMQVCCRLLMLQARHDCLKSLCAGMRYTSPLCHVPWLDVHDFERLLQCLVLD